MTTSATGEKIGLNFGWEGPSSWHGGRSHGGLDVTVVDLVFKNEKTDISVRIPDNISPATVKKLPFTCQRGHESDSLEVTAEQIHNLTIKAGIFEESPHKGPAIMDSSGKITRETRFLRSDREIELEMPKELERGRTYSLVVRSNDLSLSAHLLRDCQETS